VPLVPDIFCRGDSKGYYERVIAESARLSMVPGDAIE
jgi:hypothetical protein